MPRKICLVTGSRAEWGLLRWLAEELARDQTVALQIVATGSHLAPQFGWTREEINRDGFTIDAEVPMLLAGDDGRSIAMSVGLGVIGMSEALSRLAPDIVVLLGDRFEILAAAQAALLLGFVVAHLHGGELTLGAVDDSLRHAVTKLSHLHLVACDEYAARVRQLGEAPERVFVVGALGADAIRRTPLLDRGLLEREFDLDLNRPVLLVTFHPVTVEGDNRSAVDELLQALDGVPEAAVVITGVNADAGHWIVEEAFSAYARRWPGRVVIRNSLGQRLYLSVMAICDAVVGNSSSGMFEAPTMRVPTVNIGSRQGGRLRAASVIDCGERRNEISIAIARAASPAFRSAVQAMPAPFGDGHASERIAATLSSVRLAGLRQKTFHDLPVIGPT